MPKVRSRFSKKFENILIYLNNQKTVKKLQEIENIGKLANILKSTNLYANLSFCVLRR